MKTIPTILLASACALTLAPVASARPLHHHHHIAHASYIGARHGYPAYGHAALGEPQEDGGAFNAGAAQVPPRGFYNNYYGPGATVLRRGVAAQYEPGATQEIEPDAKQTATGGPVGGLPGRSGP